MNTCVVLHHVHIERNTVELVNESGGRYWGKNN